MDKDTILQELTEAGALLKGHFILSSGLHSEGYVQCARALIDPKRSERLCSALAQKVQASLKEQSATIDIVVAPAMGGLIVGYETARHLAVDSIFCERVEGSFEFRRGFTLPQNAKVLIVEDVVTTGKSSMEAAQCIEEAGGIPVAVASLIDRRGSSDHIALTLPLMSLVEINFPAFSQDNIPAHLKDTPAVKPGSRWLKTG